MAKNKTIETNNSVEEYLDAIPDEKRRRDCSDIIKLISKETGLVPKMWGAGIVGFGSYHYKYESGHEGDAPLAGLASRVNALTLYVGCESDRKEELLKKFGKYKMSKGCIYIQKLEDIDTKILIKLVKHSINYYKNKYAS